MISALAWAVLGSSERVSIHLPAQSAAVAIPAVAEVMRKPLKVSPELAEEILLIDVTDVDADTLLGQIARVTVGQWVESDGTITLEPNLKERRAQKDAKLAESARVLAKVLLNAENPKFYEFDESDYDEDFLPVVRQQMADELKVNRALVSALRKIGTQKLLAAGAKGRIIYSDKPTPLQHSLSMNWSLLYDRYRSNLEDEFYREDDEVYVPPYASLIGDQIREFQTKLPAFGQPVKVLLKIDLEQESGDTSLPFINIFVSDARGLQRFVWEFDPFQFLEKPEEAEVTSNVPTNTPTNLRPLKLSQDDLEIGAESMTEKVRKRLLASFTDVRLDPLDVAAAPLLRALSQSSGHANLVGCLNDDLAGVRYWIARDAHTEIDNIETFLYHRGSIAQFKDGWMTLSPRDHSSKETRVSRKALASFARNGLDAPPRLDDRADFAFATRDLEYSSLVQLVEDVLPMQESQFLDDRLDFMPIWGSLTTSQRDVLRKGGSITLGQLSKEGQDYVAQIVMNGESDIELAQGPLTRALDLRSQNLLERFIGSQGFSSWDLELTEVFPQGLSPNAVLRASTLSEPCLYYRTPQVGETDNYVLSAFDLAIMDSQRTSSRKGQEQWLEEVPPQAKLGTMTSHNLSIQLSPQLFVTGWLTDIDVPLDAPTVNPNLIDGKLKTEIDRIRREVAAYPYFLHFLNQTMSDTQGRRPPP